MTGEIDVLLVEDNDDDVVLIRRALKRSAALLQLSVVSDGDAAVAYLAGDGDYADRTRFPLPRLVLLDLKLPRRSGLEVLEWIKKREELNGMVVVVLTSSRENADLRRAYQLGTNSFLVKPVEFDRFTEMVRALDQYWIGFNESPSRLAHD